MQSAMNGSNFLHAYVFAGVSGEKGKDRSEKGREQNSSPLSPQEGRILRLPLLVFGRNLSGAFEDDSRCSFCKEERLVLEQRLKNCRIAGPIFLAIGDFFWMTSTTFIVYTRTPRKDQMLDKL